jgi:RNA polymerase sigma-70 factor (ECF subfamily)
LRPWLLRIVANEARNRRRSADRRAGLALRASVAGPRDAVAPSPESEVIADETRGLLLAALGGLRDEEREVIGARYFLGLSEAETAEALAIPAGTVKSRTARALVRLRVTLGALDGGPTGG